MNLKQKLSLFSAVLLPSLALSAYFLIAPTRAGATTCPQGQIWAGTNCDAGGCNSGGGGCYPNQSDWGQYVFCSYDYCQTTWLGAGTCNSGCVSCEWGKYTGIKPPDCQ